MEYPSDKLDIKCWTTSTDGTQQVAAEIVTRYAALGHPHYYISRNPIDELQSRGAGRRALNVAKGEFVAIFDA